MIRLSAPRTWMSVGVAVAISSSALGAQTLTFEENWWNGGASSFALITSEYGGFLWNFFGVIDRRLMDPTSGLLRTADFTNSQIVAYSDFGKKAELSRATPFTLTSAVVAGAQRNGLQLTLRGFDALNAPIYTETYTVGEDPREITPNWTDVSRVTFETSGGVPFAAPGSLSFAIDDIKIGTVVPEPSTTALLAAGLAALGIAVRRRRNRSPGGAASR